MVPEPFYIPNQTPTGIFVPLDNGDVEVLITGRYYCKGYERGNLPILVAIAEWLEFNFPGCKVHYKGDCDDEWNNFGLAARQELKKHFFEFGHLPYVNSPFFGEGQTVPICPNCKQPLISNGGGGGSTFWFCYGCRKHAATSVKGVRWFEAGPEGTDVFYVNAKLQSGELTWEPLTTAS